MESCPSSVNWICAGLGSELGPYFQAPSFNEVAAFFLGVLIVTFFAIDHYKIPTYAKTTIGEFIELSPESLTSASRYRNGLMTYIGLMLLMYTVICLVGANTFSAFAGYFTEPGGAVSQEIGKAGAKGDLWPLAAATIVTFLGTVSDKTLFGRIEYALRSLAHESAYIPIAVTHLADNLDSNFEINDNVLKAVGGDSGPLFKAAGEQQEGTIPSWIRAMYLFTRLEALNSDPQFRYLLSQPENSRAFDFLKDERDAISDRVQQTVQPDRPELDDVLKRKVEEFRRAITVFLASLLWRGCGTEAAIVRKVIVLKLSPPTGERKSSWNFILNVVATLAAAAVLVIIPLNMIDWQFRGLNLLSGVTWHISLAVCVLTLTSFFVMKRRERMLRAGNWRNSYEGYLKTAIYIGLPIGILSTLIVYTLHQGGAPVFWGMLLIGLPAAIIVSFLFPILLQRASTSVPTFAAQAASAPPSLATNESPAPMVSRIAAVAGGVAFASVVFLFPISHQLILTGTPSQITAAAQGHLNLAKEAYKAKNPADEWFYSVVRPQDLDLFGDALINVRKAIDSKTVTPDTAGELEAACTHLNEHLPQEHRLLLNGCDLNTEFTRTLEETNLLVALRNLFNQAVSLIPSLNSLSEIIRMDSAFRAHWHRALAVAIVWVVFSTAVAVSVLLFRRKMLWDDLDRKWLSDYAGRLQDPVSWLRRPVPEISNLTPLEAILHESYRATLSDLLSRPPVVSQPIRAVA